MVFSGEETYLLTKKKLFLDFNAYKDRIGKKLPSGLVSFSPHVFRGIGSADELYGHDEESIQNLVKTTQNFSDFMDLFMTPGMERKQASMWCEKTPGNALLFRVYLASFKQGKVIHIVRNPYDTLLSMLKRGMNPIYAIAIYCYNNAGGIDVADEDRYHRVKYEDLLTTTEPTTKNLCQFLEIDFHEDMISDLSNQHLTETNISSWNADETALIDASNLNTFSEADEKNKSIIHHLLNFTSTTEAGNQLFDTVIRPVSELCKLMGYSVDRIPRDLDTMKFLKKELQKDRFFRTKKLHFTSTCKIINLDE